MFFFFLFSAPHTSSSCPPLSSILTSFSSVGALSWPFLLFIPQSMDSLTWKTIPMVSVVFQLCFLLKAHPSLSHPDKIIQLPGQPQVGFQQFSGYVSLDDKKQRALFYYFVEAESDPASKPLVLWLNGGLQLF